MKEVLKLILKLDFKTLFITPTENNFLKFFRYLFVGGLAFLVDALTLYILKHWMHYLIATAIAFILGLVVNFVISKRLVFTEKAVVNSLESEFSLYGLIGIVGLGLTEILMFVFTDLMHIYVMLSKVIVAIIVLVWNFLARKFFLYRSHHEEENK